METLLGARGWGPVLTAQPGLERLPARPQNRRSALRPGRLQGRGDFSDVAVKWGRSTQAGRGSSLGEGPLRVWPAGGC